MRDEGNIIWYRTKKGEPVEAFEAICYAPQLKLYYLRSTGTIDTIVAAGTQIELNTNTLLGLRVQARYKTHYG
jgi:hypothetical protein